MMKLQHFPRCSDQTRRDEVCLKAAETSGQTACVCLKGLQSMADTQLQESRTLSRILQPNRKSQKHSHPVTTDSSTAHNSASTAGSLYLSEGSRHKSNELTVKNIITLFIYDSGL